jgi:DNA phosphorothioation-dependent restriction protein DptH
MTGLISAIVEEVSSTIATQLRNLGSQQAELRAVFNGPPQQFLAQVYELLAEQGGLRATLADGEEVLVPVLLLQEKVPSDFKNPPIGGSGKCDHNHLLTLRNSPSCPRFVVLSSPKSQSNLSQTSTWFYCGLAAENQAANTPIDRWIQDEFIDRLITKAVERITNGDKDWVESARSMSAESIASADAADEANGLRLAAWNTISRVWSLNNVEGRQARSLALALGYPPPTDNTLSFVSQSKALRKLAEQLEDGFTLAIGQFKEETEDEDEKAALDAVLAQLLIRCPTSTAVTQSMPFFYGPYTGVDVGEAPDWWLLLTVERWLSLLEQTSTSPETLGVRCVNSLTPNGAGIGPIVSSAVQLEIKIPGAIPDSSTPVQIVRDSGSSTTKRTWDVLIENGTTVWSDSEPPPHKRPLKYTVTSQTFTSASVPVISMAAFSPGVLVCGRDSRKAALPKPPKSASSGISLESSLTLRSEGRQYLTVFASPDVALESPALGTDNTSSGSERDEAAVARISDVEFGFEIKASSDKTYELLYRRSGATKPQKLLIHINCDDVQAEQCSSEFERLVLSNRSRRGQQVSALVHVDATLRSSDLQGWLLDKDYSFFPLVFGPDYAENWRVRNWESLEDTIISKGRFLSDPRPSFSEMQPPNAFVEARRKISKRIVESESGLVEGAPLGLWLADEGDDFSGILEEYLRAYTDWLAQSPEIAAWCDISIVTGFEGDRKTLVIEPDAVMLSPLHPVRIAWQACAQRTLLAAHQKKPCPAASILDPRCVPDSLTLPIRRASGEVRETVFFSVECNSDYWSVLWNSSRADAIGATIGRTPFDSEFGVLIGGLASSFSTSQVNRSMNDISELLSAKSTLNVSVTSAASLNTATNQGIIEWSRGRFSQTSDDSILGSHVGRRFLRVLDQRSEEHRPSEAEISNLAEDTENSVNWYATNSVAEHTPDLTIVAQLETSSMSAEKSILASPLSPGGLFRTRVRQQLKAGLGAFLSESRTSMTPSLNEDNLLARTANAIAHLENLGELRHSYVFAPSVHTLRQSLAASRYVAVSSSSIDPACFLGGWLENETYLWDYDLPSYSSRAGDSNGYYLLAKITDLDRETLRNVVKRLPDCDDLTQDTVDNLILEVARRGIPTVRGLSSGDSGAVGDLGLFVAARLLQDDFRLADSPSSLFPVWREDEASCTINLLIPVDPFQNYLDDFSRVFNKPRHRPDLLLVSLRIENQKVSGKLIPIEVKYRSGSDRMSVPECSNALSQTKSFAELMKSLDELASQEDLLLWRLARTHLQLSFIDYGFRVYSQQGAVMFRGTEWAERQATVMKQIIEGEVMLECDTRGRLIVIDGSNDSSPRDIDGDGFFETIGLSQTDAGRIVTSDPGTIYSAIKERLGDWGTAPVRANQSVSFQSANATNHTPSGVESTSEPQDVVSAQPTTSDDISDALTDAEVDPTTAPADSDVETTSQESNGIQIEVGFPIDAFNPKLRTFNIGDTNLNQMNIGVVGDLGTGKTQLLKSLVYQITRQAHDNRGVQPNILILDYKRDYSSDDFVKATNARVIKPQNLPLNLFDLSQASDSMTPWLDRFNFFADVLDKVYSGIGPVQRQLLKSAVRSVYQGRPESNPPTIYDVHAAYQLATNGKADSISAIVEEMVDRELFSRDAPKASTRDFLKGVVVISLDALGQDDRAKNLLVAIMLNLFYDNMLKIEKRPFYGQNPQKRVVDSFLLVDEADNIMQYEFDVLRKILLQGREFGVGVILASQYLSHFKARATDYREMLLTWLVHKVPNVQAQEINALGMTGNQTQTAERIKALGLHECLFKTFNVGGEFDKGIPFYQLVKK